MTVTFAMDGKKYQTVIDAREFTTDYGIRDKIDEDYPYLRSVEHDGTISLRVNGRVKKPFTQIEIPQVFLWF